MSDVHLHIHIPAGTKLTFDGSTLVCQPGSKIELSDDVPPVSLTAEEMAALLKEPCVDSG